VQHRLLQTDSTDGAQAAAGHRPRGTALAAVEQIRTFEAQACSCRPDTSEDITDCCSTDTRTRPGKAQRRDTFKSSTGRHRRDTRPEAAQAVVEQTSSEAAQSVKEETHIQRQHMLSENRRVQRPQSAVETQTSSKVFFLEQVRVSLEAANAAVGQARPKAAQAAAPVRVHGHAA
jgi:hypothetical protein